MTNKRKGFCMILLLFLMLVFAGCSAEDDNTAELGLQQRTDTAEDVYSDEVDAAETDSSVYEAGHTVTVDIYDAAEAYFDSTTETFGTAEITLPFTEEEAEELYLENVTVRKHEPDPDYTEILNVVAQGYSRVYKISEHTVHETAEWNYTTIEYFEGMSEDEIKIYSKERDDELRSMLSYKYVMILDETHCLVVTFRNDDLEKTAETDSKYAEIASKISVVLEPKE